MGAVSVLGAIYCLTSFFHISCLFLTLVRKESIEEIEDTFSDSDSDYDASGDNDSIDITDEDTTTESTKSHEKGSFRYWSYGWLKFSECN